VEVGEFNDEFIEIKKGLQEGERVCLRAPVGTEEEGTEGKKKAPPAKDESPPQSKAAAGSN
jgi:hypothetical protein